MGSRFKKSNIINWQIFKILRLPSFRYMPYGYKKHNTLSSAGRREELGHVVVEEGEAGGTEREGVGGEIEISGEDGGL